MENKIRIGSRDSKLAVIQAEQVMAVLGNCTLVTMKTAGDKIQHRTLDKIGGKGLFVRELERALSARETDLTVHSLKDVPTEQPEGLPLLAYTRREDARDVLVLPLNSNGIWDRTRPVGCASARRRVQLRELFPESCIEPVRGNIQTRLRKLEEGHYGALVLAAAGLHRLGLQERIFRYFSPDEMIPAAGQGILAVQGRAGELTAETALLDDPAARLCAMAERAFVRTLGGGCFAPVAAYAEIQGGLLHLRGLYATEDEKTVVRGALTGSKTEAVSLGRTLAYQLQQQAGGNL